jgi:hypothetical protein
MNLDKNKVYRSKRDPIRCLTDFSDILSVATKKAPGSEALLTKID